ncbi:MAG: hypothetical protein K2L06_03985 [Alistipes sp.]|nr:hypothetical protein [Alistipes sp.]
MKRSIIFLALVWALVSCENDNWWGDGPEPNYGLFTFERTEQIVEVTPKTKSFRLEGRYLEPADEKRRGYILLQFVPEESTAVRGKHFRFEETLPKFSEQEDGKYCTEVTIYPENITEEVRICYNVPGNMAIDPEAYPERIGQTTVVLRPATAAAE